MSRENSIVRQTAGKITGEILHGYGPEFVRNGDFYEILEAVYSALLDVDTEQEKSAPSIAPPLSIVPSGPALAQPPAPVALPGASAVTSKYQDKWDFLYNNPKLGFDNWGETRSKSGGGRGPDFRIKRTATQFADDGLWGDSMPTSFNTPEGVQSYSNETEAVNALRGLMRASA